MKASFSSRILRIAVALAIFFSTVALAQAPKQPGNRRSDLELSRPVRSWEFIDAVGQQAAIFGQENGTFEFWAYPLRVLHDFRLTFRSNQAVIPAESLARTVTVRPESTSILYATDTFSVRETFFVPVHEPGAIIALELDAFAPVEIEASFQRDFQLMWPAAIGAARGSWNDALRAFVMGADGHPFSAIIGSPEAGNATSEYATNYSSSRRDSFLLPKVERAKRTFLIAIAGSMKDRNDAEARYRQLLSGYPQLRAEAAEYYRNYLAHTVSLRLPDAQLETAYDWARISLVQGLVEDPYLGRGLVAGYRTSSEAMRPGFAWYFGRDTEWSSMALVAAGDYANTRQALDFISRYQRADGKMPHEIVQTATVVPWFKDYPYPYSAADSTPLFIIVVENYVTATGDVAFARAQWDRLQRAYQFLKSTYADYGWPRNVGVGSGWMEGGPLFPMGSEFYQSGLAVSAIRALANLARLTGQAETARSLEQEFARQQPALNQAFWSPTGNFIVIGLNQRGQRVDAASVLTTVPMWFDVVESGKAQATINELAGPEHSTDWGMRNASNRHPGFDPSGYQFGTVWPLFSGWAAVGEYRYHRALPAYANLRANAMLTLDGALGHTTEVLSGAWYQPRPDSCPQQMWSAAMVIGPMLRGMMGLSVDANSHLVRFTPHVPGGWNQFQISGISVADAVLEFAYSRSGDTIDLAVNRTGGGETTVEFSPAFSPHAKVVAVEINGKPVKFRTEQNATDQHSVLRFEAGAGETRVRIRVRNDFQLDVPATLLPLGEKSAGLKVTAETWDQSHDRLELRVAGIAGHTYELRYYGVVPAAVDGGELDRGAGVIRLRFPESGAAEYETRSVALSFAKD